MRIPIEQLMAVYNGNLFAAAFNICKNAEDARDAVQETFIAYCESNREFDSEQHIRAWLFRVVVNKAKDIRKSFWRRNSLPLEDYIQSLSFESESDSALFTAVLHLPERYRVVIHLFYYEDYSVKEIARILHMTESNIKTCLSRGRKLLKAALREDWSDDEQG